MSPEEYEKSLEAGNQSKISEEEFMSSENGVKDRFLVSENFPVLIRHSPGIMTEKDFKQASEYIKQEISQNNSFINQYKNLFDAGEHEGNLKFDLVNEDSLEVRLYDNFTFKLPIKGLLAYKVLKEDPLELPINYEKEIENKCPELINNANKIIYDGETYEEEIRSYNLKDALEVGLWLNRKSE